MRKLWVIECKLKRGGSWRPMPAFVESGDHVGDATAHKETDDMNNLDGRYVYRPVLYVPAEEEE